MIKNVFPSEENSRLLVFIAFIFLFSSCAAHQIIPSPDRINQIQKIAVVAMEPPPLIIDSFLLGKLNQKFKGELSKTKDSTTLANSLRTSVSLSQIPDQATQMVGRFGIILHGVLMIVDMTTMEKLSDEQVTEISMKMEEAMSQSGLWVPTVYLAQEAADQIKDKSSFQITVIPGVQKMPGVVRKSYHTTSQYIEYWMKPIDDWYDADTSPNDYAHLRAKGYDVVLEIGVGSYVIYNWPSYYLMTLIPMKLVDTKNGKVLGRVRNFVNAHIASKGFGPAEDLFDNGADNFRKLFSGLTKKEITNNLVNLRLLPE
jgi:hypothetical protein